MIPYDLQSIAPPPHTHIRKRKKKERKGRKPVCIYRHLELERGLSSYKHLLLLQRNQVQLPIFT